MSETTEIDLMKISENKINLYNNKGFVELIDMMPRIVPNGRFADIAVVQSARISYGEVLKTINADNNLIKFLWTNKHTTPFESVSFQIRARMPIYVARQVMRHRLFSFNEISYRYQQPKEEFHYPNIRIQDDQNRQMSKDDENLTEEEEQQIKIATGEWKYTQNNGAQQCWNTYSELVNNKNVSREVARTILPQALMTEMLIKGNARTWLHFLSLRLDDGAQQEIKDLADAISKLIEPRIPVTFKTFLDCDINNLDLPGSYVDCIAQINLMGWINNTNELINPASVKLSMITFGITGARQISKLIDTMGRLRGSSIIISDDSMKILLSNTIPEEIVKPIIINYDSE